MSMTSSRYDVVAGGHQLRGVKPESPRKDRQAPQDALLVAEKEVVAPVDDPAQRLLPRLGGAVAAGEQPKPVVDTGRDVTE